MSTHNQIDIEAHKNPDQLEREIDQKRAEIGNIVQALENKLSPGELIDTALGYVKGGSGEFFTNLTTTVKANPVPTVLTSIGLIWLMAGQNRQPHTNVTTTRYTSGSTGATGPSMGEKLSAKTHDVKADLNHQTASIKEKASSMTQSVSETLGSARSRATDSSRQASASLRDGADRARGGFNQLLREQPLALGAIGIAIGALIAASVPSTRREDEVLGEASDRVTGQLREKAEEGYQMVAAKGEEMVEKVKHDVSNAEGDRANTGGTAGTSARM
jgi:hypothetical protein